jgi:hypothetical protein
MSVTHRNGLRIRLIAAITTVVGIASSISCSGTDAVVAADDRRCPVTAADTQNWGAANRADDFGDQSSLAGWNLYDGPGHNGNGRRTPSAISVGDGTLTITGDAQGNSAGIAWNPGQMYGRWEVCARSPQAAPGYHSVLLLWPDAEDWPSGGEVDFMESTDPARQNVEGWLHYGPNDDREFSEVPIDATQWRSWAVEWTPQRLAMFVDGALWWQSTNTANLPPRPMHLCIQLDNFGGDLRDGGQLQVDWARQYAV